MRRIIPEDWTGQHPLGGGRGADVEAQNVDGHSPLTWQGRSHRFLQPSSHFA